MFTTVSIVDPPSPFPLYTVGPATSRAIRTLISSSPLTLGPPNLHPTVLGEHTGNGAALASYIQAHYNNNHREYVFYYYDAPRLPFVPLIGDHSIPRLERDDPILKKKPLLFLVGEQRRDIIPRTLSGESPVDGSRRTSAQSGRIEVEEIEVYQTVVAEDFERCFQDEINRCTETGTGTGGGSPRQCHQGQPHSSTQTQQSSGYKQAAAALVFVVVFSPSGCEGMLRVLGYLDPITKRAIRTEPDWGEESQDPTTFELTTIASSSSSSPPPQARQPQEKRTQYVIVTIGPTTRDYLVDKFGFEPHVCASKPSPRGVWDGIKEFMDRKIA